MDNEEQLTHEGKKLYYGGSKLISEHDEEIWDSDLYIHFAPHKKYLLEGDHIYKVKLQIIDKTTGKVISTECEYKNFHITYAILRDADGNVIKRAISDIYVTDANSIETAEEKTQTAQEDVKQLDSQRAEITDIRMSYISNHPDGKALVYKFNISSEGVKGHTILPCLFIYTDDGKKITYNGKDLYFKGEKLTSTHDRSHWPDEQTIRFAPEEFSPFEGKHIYKVKLFVWDETSNKWLSTYCDYHRFQLYKGSILDANGKVCGSIYTSFNNPDAPASKAHQGLGSVDDHGTIICANCAGTGREPCIECSGTGSTWSYAYNTTITCPTCHGSRYNFCQVCQGTGERHY